MTKIELAAAKKLIDDETNLSEFDDSVLHGLYLREFKAPVFTTIQVVAKAMGYQAMQLNGQWDEKELNEFCGVAKNKIRIV